MVGLLSVLIRRVFSIQIFYFSHGTADNFIQCSEGTKTWNIECLVTEVGHSDVFISLMHLLTHSDVFISLMHLLTHSDVFISLMHLLTHSDVLISLNLLTQVSEVASLQGRPKLFFIEACRGRESNRYNGFDNDDDDDNDDNDDDD